MSAALAFVVGTFLVCGLVVVRRPFRSPDLVLDHDWLTGGLPPTPTGTALVARYLQRVRTHRWVGGGVGFALALGFGIASEGSVSVGVGRGNPMSDVLFGTIAGVLVGSLLAETYRIEVAAKPRVAGMVERTTPAEVKELRYAVGGLGVFTLVLAVVDLTSVAVVLGVVALVLVGTQHLVLRRIVERRRPLLPDALEAVDDRLRDHAARRVTAESLSLAVLIAGWQLSRANVLTAAITLPFIVASLVVALLLLRRSRPYPHRGAR